MFDTIYGCVFSLLSLATVTSLCSFMTVSQIRFLREIDRHELRVKLVELGYGEWVPNKFGVTKFRMKEYEP